jgi:UDP-N-acetylmuramate dehydrogenase
MTMNSEAILSTFTSHGVTHILKNEPLANHTTWRIGGPADYLATPTSMEELTSAVRTAHHLELPMVVIGRGSNLLVQDGGVRGLVIKLHDSFADCQIEETYLTALAGRSFVSAASIAVKGGLAGLEFATGIPGTVGGAVMMNAGAYGGQVADVLEWAEVMDAEGFVERLSREQLQFAYRFSVLKEAPRIVVRARFGLTKGDAVALTEKVKAWSKRRVASQPLSLPNCGSVFRNPEGTHAGQLVESAGLKGFQMGGAQISEKHANFIVNRGSATAQDVLRLIRHAQNIIREQYGVDLETEVRVIGDVASGR